MAQRTASAASAFQGRGARMTAVIAGRGCAVRFCLTLLISVGAAEYTCAEVLGGPSSVRSDLLLSYAPPDPNYRFDFPRNLVPGYFDWKDRLEARGIKFNFEYLSLGQSTNAAFGPGKAVGGLARLYGTWQATSNGSLTFKVENRRSYTSVSPQGLGEASGALSVTGTVFSDAGTILTNLFWTHTAKDKRWAVRFGLIDVTDYLDSYGLVSPYAAFQNAAFSTSPTIAAPSQGLGVAGAAQLGDNFLVFGSVADANADPTTSPDFDVVVDGDLFKSLDLVYTTDVGLAFYNNAHVTIWHSDAASDGSRAEDYGATVSLSAILQNGFYPFFRAGRSRGTAALYDRSISTGLGYFASNGDLAAVGFDWSGARDIEGTQFTAEAFYRFSLSPGLELTPSIQFIKNPLLDPSGDGITLISLRGRFVF